MASRSMFLLMVLASLTIVVVANPLTTAVYDIMKEALVEDKIEDEPLFVKDVVPGKKDMAPIVETEVDESAEGQQASGHVTYDNESPNESHAEQEEDTVDMDEVFIYVYLVILYSGF